jgi:hypothetical protein
MMSRIRFYRVSGGIMAVPGLVGYLLCAAHIVNEEDAVRAIVALVLIFPLNIFLWLGLILLWRADRNEKPAEKSGWLTLLKAYIVITLTIIGAIIAMRFAIRIFCYFLDWVN